MQFYFTDPLLANNSGRNLLPAAQYTSYTAWRVEACFEYQDWSLWERPRPNWGVTDHCISCHPMHRRSQTISLSPLRITAPLSQSVKFWPALQLALTS